MGIMYYYVKINAKNVVEGIVINSIELQDATLVQINLPDDAMMEASMTLMSMIGRKKWNGSTFETYVAPPRILSKYKFNEKFTFAELVAITTAAKTDVEIEVMMTKLNLAGEINLDEPSLQLSVDLLIYKGLVAPERKAEILELD
jgi:mRNA-degrading endonuclease toxin of MazEF toxin-antitoxin module